MPSHRGSPRRAAPRLAAELEGLSALRAEILRFRAADVPGPARRVRGAARVAGVSAPGVTVPTQPRPRRAVPGGPAVPPVPGVPAGPGVPEQPIDGPEPVAAPPPEPEPAARGSRQAYVPTEVLADLVARAQAGDAEAFGGLYDLYVDVVYRYVYYRVGSTALAEDLVSETFLRALRRISSFSWQGRDVAAWFITIARNLIADHYKSGRYRLEVSTEDMIGASGDKRSDEDPERSVLASLDNRTLIEAVKKLGAEQQECIVLRFLQGLSVSETAEAMGKNDGSIKALQYRAVRALARHLPAGFTP